MAIDPKKIKEIQDLEFLAIEFYPNNNTPLQSINIFKKVLY